MKIKIKWINLIIVVLICQAAGIIGTIFTTASIPVWYANLEKPFFSPPNWIFAPVWITLYTLMGVSAYLVWEEIIKNGKVKKAFYFFGAQLILNSLWSFLFFGLKSPFIAFIEIIFLWFLILATIIKFYRISKTAAYLLIPYIIWVSFAMILNFYIMVLN